MPRKCLHNKIKDTRPNCMQKKRKFVHPHKHFFHHLPEGTVPSLLRFLFPSSLSISSKALPVLLYVFLTNTLHNLLLSPGRFLTNLSPIFLLQGLFSKPCKSFFHLFHHLCIFFQLCFLFINLRLWRFADESFVAEHTIYTSKFFF